VTLARKVVDCLLFTGAAVTLAFAIVCMIGAALAEDAHHHPGESAAVDAFYSSWHMPDRPSMPCCNHTDCYATEARFLNGHWMAKRR
jgi:hypothetical protein